jgi:hypothetical protein
MCFHGGKQQVPVTGPFFIHLEVGNDLVLGLPGDPYAPTAALVEQTLRYLA